MRADVGFLGAIGIFGAACLTLVLARLSRRLGAVTGAPRLYRVGYVAASLLSLAGIGRLLLDFGQASSLARLIAYDLPLASGALSAAIVTVRYWGWLLHE
ncbi:MAG: hypothetical protein ACYC5O_09355 [Anaerolineae bacterium]